MKICIWCRLTDEEATFNKLAHTIPKSLGGKSICINVCDNCNSFFGNRCNGYPSVEAIIKETFNVSRVRLLDTQMQIGKNKPLTRFSSLYFDVDIKKHKMGLKASYKHQRDFQEKVGHQLKKGLYKMFLEETERQFGNGLDPQFDFIREFARYNIGDYPVFYYERIYGIIMMNNSWVENPELLLEEDSQFKYLVKEPSFVEFEFLGHVLGLATSTNWEQDLNNYLSKSFDAKKEHFKVCRYVKKFSDIDLLLHILDDK